MLIVGLGGTTVSVSSTERAVGTCPDAASATDVETVMLGAEDLDLPMYAPERPERSPRAERLIELLREPNGVIIGSPGYHGTLSGLVETLWTTWRTYVMTSHPISHAGDQLGELNRHMPCSASIASIRSNSGPEVR